MAETFRIPMVSPYPPAVLRRIRLSGLLLALTAASAFGQGPARPGGSVFRLDLRRPVLLWEWRVREAGPGVGPAVPALDASWETVTLSNFRRRVPGVRWYRSEVRIEGRPAVADVLAFQFVNVPIAFEVYWDGALVGRNGTVGADRTTEVPGRFHFFLPLGPDLTRPGRHEIALKVSNHRRTPNFLEFSLLLGYASDLQAALREFLDPSLLYLGLYYCALLFCLVFFLGGGRNRSYLIFGGYILLAQMWWLADLVAYTSPLPVTRFAWLGLLAIWTTRAAPYGLVPFLAVHFRFRRPWLHIGVPLAVWLLLELSGLRARLGWGIVPLIAAAYALGLAAAALRRKNAGSGLMTAAFLAAFLRHGIVFLWAYVPALRAIAPRYLFTIGDGLFLGLVILSISMALREQNRRLHQLQLQSQRLESELLKKSIQPHFIMNTLLSIKSLFLQDPGKAEDLIEALAEEFRVISRIASEREIALDEEIRLCRNHLEVMGFRRGGRYSLAVEGGDGEERVPPMIFHTLIENGLTHAYAPGENGCFHLNCGRSEGEIRYAMRNDGSRLRALAGWPAEKVEEGMGLRYIRSRLEESYPGRWRLLYGLRDGLWETVITVRP